MNVDTTPKDLWAELERAGEVPAAPEDALLAARVAVRRAATTETLRADVTRARRRRRMRVAALVMGVVAASVAFGTARLDIRGHDVGVSSAAAAVLERAAQATLAESDLVTGPGQYLRITLVEQSWGTSTGEDGKVLRGNDGRLVVQQERRTRTIWAPHDMSQDWTFRENTSVLRHNSEDPAYRDAGDPGGTSKQQSWSDRGSRQYLKTYDPAWYAGLPRNPQQLIARLDSDLSGEGSGLAYRFEEKYSEVLRSGIAPADVRAALFEGLAKTKGMEVDDDVTTLDGRRGVAISAHGSNWQMVFDRETGRYIGDRGTSPDFPDVPGLDADKTTWLTSVTTEVVADAPKATS